MLLDRQTNGQTDRQQTKNYHLKYIKVWKQNERKKQNIRNGNQTDRKTKKPVGIIAKRQTGKKKETNKKYGMRIRQRERRDDINANRLIDRQTIFVELK